MIDLRTVDTIRGSWKWDEVLGELVECADSDARDAARERERSATARALAEARESYLRDVRPR